MIIFFPAQKDAQDASNIPKTIANHHGTTTGAQREDNNGGITHTSTNDTTQDTQTPPTVSDNKAKALPVRQQPSTSLGNTVVPGIPAQPSSSSSSSSSSQTLSASHTSTPSGTARASHPTAGKAPAQPASESSKPVDEEYRRCPPKIEVGPGKQFSYPDECPWAQRKATYNKNGHFDLFG